MRRRIIWLALIAAGSAEGPVRTGSAAAPPEGTADGGEPALRLSTPQALFFLWQDLKALEREKRKLGPAGFHQQAVGKTVAYLEIDGAVASAFTEAVDKTMKDIEGARKRVEREQRFEHAESSVFDGFDDPQGGKLQAAWARYGRDQDAAIDRVLSMLGGSPRHRLFRKDGARWTLFLDYHLHNDPP